jgi:aminoglycoside/choline kinase family phosphotransferase
VTGLRKAQVPDRKALNDEFHALAKTVSAFLPTIIHRDMQSQNIMVSKGAPRLIDYQGARMAPPAYDIASLLWDPYYRLDDDMRMRLLTYYREAMQAGSRDFDVRSFQDSIIPCCLQRHMQALGAYGFLSLVKGRKYFMKHVPEALRLLRADAEHARNEYPVLHSLVRQLT